jgi:hypothetical protein
MANGPSASHEPSLDVELDETSDVGADASGTVTSGSKDLAMLAAGQLDLAAYVDLQVERAVAPYAGSLSPSALEDMRQVLRAQLSDDPGLAAWLKEIVSGVADGLVDGASADDLLDSGS